MVITSIDIDLDKLLTGTKSNRETVDLAPRTLIALRQQPTVVERIIGRRFDASQIDAPTITPPDSALLTAACRNDVEGRRELVVTIPTVRSDAARIAAGISADLASENSATANESAAFLRYLQLTDNLAAERGATRVGLTLAAPAPTGSVQWDTAIAALCEYRLNADSLPVPDWVGARSGNPGEPWAPRTSDYDIPVDVSQVPPEFLSRGILIEAADLESV